VYPLTSTGNVSLYARLRPPTRFTSDTAQEVKLDEELMLLKSLYDYLEDDASNPGAADKFLAQYEMRLDQVRQLMEGGPFLLDEENTDIPDDWFDRNDS